MDNITSAVTLDRVRNFAIIAHIDHGKSTLADRIMEICGAIKPHGHEEQLLDSHPVSRERGITIRLAPVTMSYTYNKEAYTFNLIDTPGHVDFSYEVERSLAACEGVILLVDATQGIQAQTLSHYYKAKKLGLKIIPVVNKVDLPNAQVEEAVEELSELTGTKDILEISGKTGKGVTDLLEKIITQIDPPKALESNDNLSALVFSSQYDPQRGIIAFVRIFGGSISQNQEVYLIVGGKGCTAMLVGHFYPEMKNCHSLQVGEVGYVITNIKDPSGIKVGETITTKNSPAKPLEGYREPQPVVFVSFFPVDQDDFYLLEDSLKKLKLNDSAITFTPTSSKALGRGFRCGFLGHLHAEVSQERIEKDFDLAIIATAPAVEYQKSAETLLEPWVRATIITPVSYLGATMQLCEDRRGLSQNIEYHGNHVTMIYELPLSEIITDFFDKLKSGSSGYASIDYEIFDYRPFDAVQMDILINHEPIDAMAQILEKTRAERYGRVLVEKLKEAIPRQQFAFPIQASINNQIVARADVSAFRKDVIAKLYGGDRTRKDKLLEAQKKGKKKMKSIGHVELPGDIFLKVFKT